MEAVFFRPLIVPMATDAAAFTKAAPHVLLHDAAKLNKADEVVSLIAGRADPQVCEPGFGWSALHVAAGNGATAAADALLDARALVNARANDGEVPLHLASADGHTQVIKLLAAGRADVNATNADHETPLHVGVQHVGSKPLGHLRALLALRADPSLQDKEGQDAFQSAGLFTNRAEEVREVLSGAPKAAGDPDDVWPETAGELPAGTEPLDVAESLRELGNTRFKDGKYEQAVQLYFKARQFLPTGSVAYATAVDVDLEAQRARTCRIAVSSNAAACKLKLGDHDACIRLCDTVLSLDEGNVKALYRKSLALRATGEEEKADTVLRKAAEICPTDAAVQKELKDLELRRRKEKDDAKRLAKKMFG